MSRLQTVWVVTVDWRSWDRTVDAFSTYEGASAHLIGLTEQDGYDADDPTVEGAQEYLERSGSHSVG